MTEEFWRLSAVDVAEGIRARQFLAEDVMLSVTERIHTRNCDLNAIIGLIR
ncbi:MAG: hypothetical protein QGF12_06755 [SAR202 cluster bacterium]|jgi:hypothetical protein|nr:hypothetical protein [SAR202 cluster bacterium]